MALASEAPLGDYARAHLLASRARITRARDASRQIAEQRVVSQQAALQSAQEDLATAQAQVAWAVNEGIGAAVCWIEEQIESGAFDGGAARCQATTRKGKPCQRTPLPEREYCPSHQHLETGRRTAQAA